MGLRNGLRVIIKDWLGLNTFASSTNLKPGWWRSSNNVVVTNDGSAACLRSPIALLPTAGGDITQAIFLYEKSTGPEIIFDEGDTAVSMAMYVNSTGTNIELLNETGTLTKPKYLTVNDRLYRLHGSNESFSTFNGVVGGVYDVGIPPPASAPTISFVAGGSGSITTGITVSYAYRNSTTGHVSAPSPASSSSGASGANLTLRVPVVASALDGVDGIVLFISQDSGTVRYLYVDSNGDPVINANTTGNIDVSLDIVDNLDTLTPETSYNTHPGNTFDPGDAPRFMFRYREHIVLCDWRGAETRQQLQYNVMENCYYGIPWESWFPSNIIVLPSKGDAARCGVETPVGALVLGEQDAYIIRGHLTDKIASPQQTISITESVQSMNWSIGTRSPFTLKSTPYGEMWLDQNKRIQLWARSGHPVEAGLPIRSSLDAILDTNAARDMAEAEWYQHGDNGGFYALTACTSGSANNKIFFIGVYLDPETAELRFACSVSDIATQTVATVRQTGTQSVLAIGGTRVRKILDLDVSGDGWLQPQTRFFTTTVGNDDEYCYWHTLRFDATSVQGLKVTVQDHNGANAKDLVIQQPTGNGGSYSALMDTYGFRKDIKFTFNYDDNQKRIIQNLRVFYSSKDRVM